MMTGLKKTLERIDYWIKDWPAQPEKVLEVLLLLEIFREHLGYGVSSAVPQRKAGTRPGAGEGARPRVADILLKPVKLVPERWVVLEIKRPSTTLAETHIRQAGRYAAQVGARWVILTNWSRWLLVRVLPSSERARRRFRVETLLELRLDARRKRLPQLPRQALLQLLWQCRKSTVNSLFNTWSRIHDLGDGELRGLVTASTPRTLPLAIVRAAGITPSRDNMRLLRTVCSEVGFFLASTVRAHSRLIVDVPA
jgi:hypothetical protein